MSWWLAIALVYLALCWVGWIVTFRVSWAEEENSDDRFIGFLFRQRPEIYWLSLSLLLLVIGPFFPFAMVYGLWMGWKERRAWRKFKRTHREMLLEPMHPANFPRAAQEHIERCSPVLLGLGFAPAGSYLLKPEPFPIYSQCLLSRAGETSVDVSLIDEMPSVSYVSVMENGHVLETGCCTATLPDKHLAAINRSGRFTVQMFQPQEDEEFLAEVYHRHRALLAELEQRLGCGSLHLPLDQVPAIKRYENCVYGEVLFALGKKDNRPQPPQCPTGLAKRISLVL